MRRLEQGFNLIEVMVALVILSLGVLGMAALQFTSIQQNQDAYFRSQATLLAYDLADRIRLNNDARDNYLQDAAGVEDTDCISYSGDTNGCNSAEMAQHDLFEWFALLGRELPSGNGLVCRSDLADDVPGVPDCEDNGTTESVVVYIWWTEKEGGISMMAVSTDL